MYLEFLRTIMYGIIALNTITELPDVKKAEEEELGPYFNDLAVYFAGELCGFIRDEIGGQYSYHDATDAEREWWRAKP